MLTPSTPNTGQQNLFHSELFSQLNQRDPLIKLANTIDWHVFDVAFSQHYCHDNGRPSKTIRSMVGLLILKQLENLSDEQVVLQFKRNEVLSILLWLSKLTSRICLVMRPSGCISGKESA